MELKLRYKAPAPDGEEGWERYSLPIGNSALGANVFGGTQQEHVTVTENSLENDYSNGGLNTLADIFVEFGHGFEEVTGYERTLSISDSFASVEYRYNGNRYERTYFASYPDRALVGRFVSEKPDGFKIRMEIPFLNDSETRGKSGSVESGENVIILKGLMSLYNIRFEGMLKVFTNGKTSASENSITVTDATDSYFIFCGATNYELCSEVFLNDDPQTKLKDYDPHDKVQKLIDRAGSHTYDELRSRHTDDYHELFNRVELDLGEQDPMIPTDELIERQKTDERSRYLEVLYFQFGRYLMISSSRPGCLPANLQGVWNYHDKSPWGSGYWHNINVQMNYWPVFVTGLDECFTAYLDFYKAFLPKSRIFAGNYILEVNPRNYDPAEPEDSYGWTIGTASYPYTITPPRTSGHSGPGTGALTSKLFWEYYAFSGDRERLREVTYPALLEMAKFLTKVVRDFDGKYLSCFSASPEQGNRAGYYHTVGCAFDQQMIWENSHDLLICVDILGEDTLPEKDRKIIDLVREQIDKYDPVQIGWSGQIKEFREEKFYGEIGEYAHRHISHLVGLYPGTLISKDNPAWFDAAKVALNHRTDNSTGWALAHRLNAWARTGDGNRAYRLYNNLLSTKTLPNLWDTHPPFQIDGNFGGTSGIAEMLLQSHEEYINILPSLPDVWDKGLFKGLRARGGFVIDVQWNGCSATKITVRSIAGNTCKISSPNIAAGKTDFDFSSEDRNHIIINTKPGGVYTIENIPGSERIPVPEFLKANRDLELSWKCSRPVKVWRAVNSEPNYTLIADNADYSFRDTFDFDSVETVTYKISAGEYPFDPGKTVTVNHSTEAYREWYRRIVPKDLDAGMYLGE